MEIFNQISQYIDIVLEGLGIYGPILGCVLICFESILPFLPLSVFITLNFMAFGNFWGFIISWVFTILGCLLSFFIVRTKVKKWFDQKIKDKPRVNRIMQSIENISFSNIVVIMAMPFTPAFIVNIAAALTKMTYKRFIFALILGKMFMVYFWGYIGVSLVESLKNPYILIKIGIMLLVAYIISAIINKKYNLD